MVNRAVLFSWGASAVLWCAAAFGEPYRFTHIADTTTAAPVGAFTGFRHASISGGTVAFEGNYVGGHGIFTGAGGALRTLVKSGDAGPQGAFSRVLDPIISGEAVAFAGIYGSPGSGYYVSSGGAVTTIVKTGDLFPPVDIISVLPAFAFEGDSVAFLSLHSLGRGVFLGSGGPLTTISNNGVVGFHVAISGGTVVYTERVGDLPPTGRILAGSGGSLTTIVEPGDAAPAGTFSTVFRPTIDGNVIAFVGVDDDGEGIFTIDGMGTLTTIVRVGDVAPIGTFSEIVSHANSGNEVAFFGQYAGGVEHGLFVGTGGAPTPVVQTGDSLFGSTVVGLGWTRFGFDVGGTGNLAFNYALADGRIGVALAAPVPEPIGLAKVVLVLAIAARYRWRLGHERNNS
jgi:hypothetical protein